MGRIIRLFFFTLPFWMPAAVIAAPLETLFTLKQGELLQDETWSGKILLVSDVVVPAGRTLNIAPGIWVVFNEADFENRGNRAQQSELIVDGTLIAEADSIVLSHLSDPQVQEYILQQGNTPEVITIAPQPVDPSDLTGDWKTYKRTYALLWAILFSSWLIL